jgi:hypothetical protein
MILKKVCEFASVSEEKEIIDNVLWKDVLRPKADDYLKNDSVSYASDFLVTAHAMSSLNITSVVKFVYQEEYSTEDQSNNGQVLEFVNVFNDSDDDDDDDDDSTANHVAKISRVESVRFQNGSVKYNVIQ